MMRNLTKKTAEAFENLCNKQEANLNNPFVSNMEEEAEAYRHSDHISGLEENFLKQWSKLHWLRIGDRKQQIFFTKMLL